MPGTKETCPCGSGKTFEKCCGQRKVFYSLEQARWRRAGQDLRRSLGQFADRPIFSWDAARAQDLYLGCIEKKLIDSDDDFIMERCFEWFIFDYKLCNGQSVIDTYRDEHRHLMSELEAELLRKWAVSFNSLYEVTGVLPEEGLLIRDILNRREIKVSDVNAALEIEQGSLLLMRVLEVGKEYEFSTSGLALPGKLKEPLLKKLHRDRLHFNREQKNKAQGWGAYLKERAHVVNAWVMDLGIPNPGSGRDVLEKETTERMAILPITSWEAALGTIRKAGQFNLLGEKSDASGAFRQATAAILGENPRLKDREEAAAVPGGEVIEPGSGITFLRPVIGHLVLTTRFIIITAGTVALLSECKDLLMKLFNKIIINGIDNWHKRKSTPPAPGEDTVSHNIGSREADIYSWPELGYAVVAVSIREELQMLGYSHKQQRGAIRLWFDYCSKERPTIRKTAVWSAAVIYAFAWLEREGSLKQKDLAKKYGVAPSTISSGFNLLRSSLNLVAKDTRYTDIPV
jgi:hypothetical protein